LADLFKVNYDMKKLIFISCFFFQVNAGFSQVKIGAKGGFSISNQQNAFTGAMAGMDPLVRDGKSAIHLYGGLFTELLLADNFLFRPHLMITDGGYKMEKIYDGLGNEISDKRTFTLHYVTIPAHFLYSPSLSIGHLWIGTGPYAGLLINGHSKSATDNIKLSIGNDPSDDFKRFDFGISSTIGIKLKSNWLIGIDQSIGFADVTAGKGRSKNSMWSFYVGYFIR
jgi:hypothetical protein